MPGWKFGSLLYALLCASAQAGLLPALAANPGQTSVSGLSAGAFMAVQLQVAYSKDIIGSGVIAGGPYRCAGDPPPPSRLDPWQWRLKWKQAHCMGAMPFLPPTARWSYEQVRKLSEAGLIDDASHLARDRVYVFSGSQDRTVTQRAVDATSEFFELVLDQSADQPGSGLRYVSDKPAGHAIITTDQGQPCDSSKTPFINRCVFDGAGYDQAGELLQHIYGRPPLAPPQQPSGRVTAFDQKAYSTVGAGMAATGYLYTPESCSQAGAACRVHIALHGCAQSDASLQEAGRPERFHLDAGYNRWADALGLLVLYPQVDKSSQAGNPHGCWDWWGYTGELYASKSAPQMKAIMAMVQRLTEPVTGPKANAQPAPVGF